MSPTRGARLFPGVEKENRKKEEVGGGAKSKKTMKIECRSKRAGWQRVQREMSSADLPVFQLGWVGRRRERKREREKKKREKHAERMNAERDEK